MWWIAADMGDDMTMSPFGRMPQSDGSLGVLAMLSVLVVIPAALIVNVLEADLVLPALSVLLFSLAAIAAAVAGLIKAEKHVQHVTLWDIAGGLAITGCAATVFGEPDQAVQLFEHLFERSEKR
jgi:hypothetical protein